MTVSSSYGAQLDAIQVASQHVQDVAAQIQTQLSQLDSNLEPLTSTWVGQGASSFQALHQRWQEDAQKINQVLGQISEGLQQNYTQYTQAEDATNQKMNATASGL
jgi:WXG100 family type VII secretion target